MFNLFTKSRPARAVALLAVVTVPLGLWAYNGGFASVPLPIDQPVGYVAQDDITNFDLTSGTESLFRPEYDRKNWSGNLHSYPVNAAGQINTSAENWPGGVSQVLSTQTQRYIATMDSSGNGVAFTYANAPSVLTTSNITIGTGSYTGQQIVDYLRGDVTNENVNGLRVRSSKLGDIIHSRPYFYNDDVDDTVFVGANDGMLHAINSADGSERWAYVPSMLHSKLKTLAYNPTDVTNPFKHDYFVDGQINTGNISNSSGTSIAALFGSLGGGGQGLYALDISTLTASSDSNVASKALWEITPTSIKRGGTNTPTNAFTGYSHLGYTFGTPQLVKINNGGSALDVLIVGNGYDTAGYAYLYVINAYTGARIAELRGGTGTPASGSANGIFEPHALDINGDGYVDRVYAADLNGNLWKFNLSDPSPTNWVDGSLVFTSTSNQPVTSTLGIARHPNGGYMIEFGTGSTLSGTYGTFNHTTNTWTTAGTGDMTTTSPTTYWVYGIWDNETGTFPIPTSSLVTQTLEERNYTYNGVSTRVRRASANAVDWATKRGWMVALPAGERITGEGSFLENGRFYFNSYNPTVNPTLITGTDTDIYGENWLMELNYLTGGSSTLPFLDLNSDLILDNNDRIPYIAGDTIPTGSSAGSPILTPNEKGIPVGKFISTGVQSQPLLVELLKLNTTLINQNPDVIYPTVSVVDRGVAGGHFDVDYFYPPTTMCSNLSGGAGAQAAGSVKFTYSSAKTSANVTNLKITAPNGEVLYSGNPGKVAPKNLDDLLDTISSANYIMTKNGNGDNSTVLITSLNPGSAYNGAITVSLSIGGSSNNGYTVTNLTGGSNPSAPGPSNSTQCGFKNHIHEYDDLYNKTGMNFLNPSSTSYLLSKAIPSTTTPFKVLVMNQYLNPAVQIHIGRNDYNPASAVGYVAIKNFQTSSGLTIAALPTYTRANIGSFALNMPVDAFSVRNWFGTDPSDNRVGLMPTSPACVYTGNVINFGSTDGNTVASTYADLYNPVDPDTSTPPTGPGTGGTSTGARHNGAITVQIIKDTTPQEALEMNVAGHPEYGYRVNHANFYSYVLAEYAMYWHHPSRVCFGDSTTRWYNGSNYGSKFSSASSGAWNTNAIMNDSTRYTGWKKDMPQDTKASTANATPAPNSTDPSIGALGATGGNTASASTTVSGNVTTTRITYTDGTYTIIITTAGTDKTTISTTDYTSTGVVVTTKTVTVANASGKTTTGGDESGVTLRSSRISWRELVRP